MADNAVVKILTALLKHQVKKIAGDETLGIIGQEIAALGGDKVDDQINRGSAKRRTRNNWKKPRNRLKLVFVKKWRTMNFSNG